MLELVERLADLYIKRARIQELANTAWSLVPHQPELRAKADLYTAASKALFAEITRIEALIVKEREL